MADARPPARRAAFRENGERLASDASRRQGAVAQRLLQRLALGLLQRVCHAARKTKKRQPCSTAKQQGNQPIIRRRQNCRNVRLRATISSDTIQVLAVFQADRSHGVSAAAREGLKPPQTRQPAACRQKCLSPNARRNAARGGDGALPRQRAASRLRTSSQAVASAMLFGSLRAQGLRQGERHCVIWVGGEQDLQILLGLARATQVDKALRTTEASEGVARTPLQDDRPIREGA